MEDEIDNNFESKIQERMKPYFEKNLYLTSQDELGALLEEIEMSPWNTDEIKEMVWNSLLEYQKEGKIDYEGTKKAFHELLNIEGQSEENSRITTYVRENDESKKKEQQKYETPENLNQSSCFKLYQLRKVFSLLNLSNRDTIKIGDIKDLVNNTDFIKLSEAEIINSILTFSSQKSTELNMALSLETNLIINKAGYQHTLQAIEDKLIKEYKNTDDDDEDYSFHEDKEPNELIDQIENTQSQSFNYLSVINDIKIALTNTNVDIICTYEKIVQNNDYSLKPTADAFLHKFESQLRDFEIFLKGLMNFAKENATKIDSLKGGVNQLYKEIQVGNEQYKDLFEKYSSNQALDLQDEITEAFEENMIMKEEKEDLKRKLEKLLRELGNRDLEIIKLNYDHTIQMNNYKEEIAILKKEKEELSEKFENTFQDVLEKIKEETKAMENKGTLNNDDGAQGKQMDIKTLKHVLAQMSFSPEEKEVAMEIKKQLTKGNQEELIRNVIKTEINNKRLNEQQDLLNEHLGIIEREKKNSEKESASRNNEITILKSKVQLLENKVHDLNLEIQAKNPPTSYCLGRMSRISLAQDPMSSTTKKGAGNPIFGAKKTAQFDVFGSQLKQPGNIPQSASNANNNNFSKIKPSNNTNIDFIGALTSEKKEPTTRNVQQQSTINAELKAVISAKKKEGNLFEFQSSSNKIEFQGKTLDKTTDIFQSNVEFQGKTSEKKSAIFQNSSSNEEFQIKTQDNQKQKSIGYQSSTNNMEIQGNREKKSAIFLNSSSNEEFQIKTQENQKQKPISYQSSTNNMEIQGNRDNKNQQEIVYQSSSSNVEYQGNNRDNNKDSNILQSNSSNVEFQGINKENKNQKSIAYQRNSLNLEYQGNIQDNKKQPPIVYQNNINSVELQGSKNESNMIQNDSHNVELQGNVMSKNEINTYQSEGNNEYQQATEAKNKEGRMEYQIEQSNDTILTNQGKDNATEDIDQEHVQYENENENEEDYNDNIPEEVNNEEILEKETITVDGYLPGIDEEANEDDKENERKESNIQKDIIQQYNNENKDEAQSHLDGEIIETTTTTTLEQLSDLKLHNSRELMQLYQTKMRQVKSQANFESNYTSSLMNDKPITQKQSKLIFENNYLDIGSEDEINTITKENKEVNDRTSAMLGMARGSQLIVNENTNANLEDYIANTEGNKRPKKKVVKRTFSEIYDIPKTHLLKEIHDENKHLSESSEKKKKGNNSDENNDEFKLDNEDIVQKEINKIKINPKKDKQSDHKAIPSLKIKEMEQNKNQFKKTHRNIHSDRIIMKSNTKINKLPEEEYKDNLHIKYKPATGKKKPASTLYQSMSYKFNSPMTLNADNNKKLLEHLMDLNENSKMKSIYKNDYLSLHAIEAIQDKLKGNKENFKTCELFSDFVFLFDEINKKARKIILVTDQFIYFFNPITLTSDCEFSYNNLESIYVSGINPNMINFHFKEGQKNDVLIETFKKTELLLFIKDNYNKGERTLHFKFEKNMSLNLKGKFCSMQDSHKHFKNMPYFEFGRKAGYLFKYKGGFLSKKFQEQFVVLTDVGLLYFEDITKPPRRLIPIIGSNVETLKNPFQLRPFVFKITLIPSNEVHIFSAHTEEELHDWTNGFDKLKKQYDKKMKQLDTIEQEIERLTVYDQEQDLEEYEIIDDNESDYSD